MLARGLVAASILGSLAFAQPMMPRDGEFRGFDTNLVGIDQKLGGELPLDTTWINEKGETVRLGDFFNQGRPVVIAPVWYECDGTCVLTFDGLLKSFIGMKKATPGVDYEVITFSMKPTEGPKEANVRKDAVMAVYNKPGVEKGWHFLSGDLKNISQLTSALGYRYTWNEKLNKINHPSGIMIATPDGKISNYIYGVEYAPALVDRYLTQARTGEIAKEPAPVILMGCFEWDPRSGSIRLNMWRAVQIGGVLTILALLTTIITLSIKHKQPWPVRRRRGGGR